MFRKWLANWLLKDAPLFEDGVNSIIEKELYQYKLLTNRVAKRMEVPLFIHTEFLAECERRGVSNTDSFAGVLIAPSTSNRFIIS
ncbi:hypothetical protein NB545_19690 [Vibrio campbellii]|uniref:hypothetical protein n=1 Tax=Vibrio campbellii TaxID=680 RepID=UPI00215C40E1|nr:hypothetical protein [Vibrio campbellii]MCR9909660.1 hypothetical protein [Vibrio campbellii]